MRRLAIAVVAVAVATGGPPSAGAAPFVYVTNFDVSHPQQANGTISQYEIGPAGRLLPLATPTVVTGRFPIGVAVSADGKSVYVAASADHRLFQYDVGTNGELTPKVPASVPSGQFPQFIAISPDGTSSTPRSGRGRFLNMTWAQGEFSSQRAQRRCRRLTPPALWARRTASR